MHKLPNCLQVSRRLMLLVCPRSEALECVALRRAIAFKWETRYDTIVLSREACRWRQTPVSPEYVKTWSKERIEITIGSLACLIENIEKSWF